MRKSTLRDTRRDKTVSKPPRSIHTRALAPSTHRSRLVTVTALLAVGASLVTGSALSIACNKPKEDASPDPTRLPAASTSTAVTSASAPCHGSAHPTDGLHIP